MSKNDWLNELKGINILLWRIHLSDPSGIREARLKIKIAEEMGIVCYPNTIMAQLYEDKIAQKFFFERNNVAIPDTFVSFSCRDSLEFPKLVKYPLVAKTSEEASSSGVSLLKDQRAAEKVVRTVFAEESYFSKLLRHIGYRLNSSRSFIQLWKKSFKRNSFQYVYFQEFIESDYDLRILTIGNEIASAFIRMNRPGDFRASGSGIWKSIILKIHLLQVWGGEFRGLTALGPLLGA